MEHIWNPGGKLNEMYIKPLKKVSQTTSRFCKKKSADKLTNFGSGVDRTTNCASVTLSITRVSTHTRALAAAAATNGLSTINCTSSTKQIQEYNGDTSDAV